MATIDLYGLGVRTSVTCGGPRAAELADAVRTAWARCLDPLPDALEGGRLEVDLHDDATGRSGNPRATGDDGVTRLAGPALDSLLQQLTQAVTTRNIAAQTGRLLMLHAGAVTNRATGASIAYVAPGGTGKTTLTARLGRRWGYLTDETVGVRADGTVVPYEKPLSVRPDRFAGVKHELSPSELRLARPDAPPRLTRLLLIRREPGLDRPRVEELGTIDAIVELTPETSALSALPAPLTRLAALLDAIGPVLRITYSEGATTARFLDRLLEGDP